jgi:hypothetical protein
MSEELLYSAIVLLLCKLETWLMSKLVRPSLGHPGYIRGTQMP